MTIVDTTATAGSLHIPSLYHYQAYNEGYLRKALHQHVIRFSNPKDFNDPWDCRPWFNVPATAAKKKEFLAKAKEAHQKRFPARTRNERRQAAKAVADLPGLLEKTIEDISKGMWTTMQEQYRVYCLSTKPDSPLMWGHYADKHRGVCLEFACDNEIVSSALPIQYGDTFPPYELFTGDPLLPFVAKSSHWSYESEFRLVSEERGKAKSKMTLKTEDGLLNLPAGAIRSIIVGALASDATITGVVEIANRAVPGIAVSYAVRVPNHYKIQITHSHSV